VFGISKEGRKEGENIGRNTIESWNRNNTSNYTTRGEYYNNLAC
jgi:hypothetical protein